MIMDFEKALKELREGKPITDGDVIIKPGEVVEDLNLTMCMQCTWQLYVEPSWEPKGGDYFVRHDGCIDQYASSYVRRTFGTERPTEKQAEEARDKMRVYNRLLAYVDEYSEGDHGDKSYIIIEPYKGNYAPCQMKHINLVAPYDIKMSKAVAEQLCKDLNSGRVVL